MFELIKLLRLLVDFDQVGLYETIHPLLPRVFLQDGVEHLKHVLTSHNCNPVVKLGSTGLNPKILNTTSLTNK